MSERYEWKQLEQDIAEVLEQSSDNGTIIDGVRPLLEKLLKQKNLIPTEYRTPLPNKYAQYLLYKPVNEAFSVIAFVWGPKQVAPVHDHLVWGLVGLYEGSIVERRYRRLDHGEAAEPRHTVQLVGEVTAKQGDISYVYPPDYDIHGVENPFDGPAITIHIYGTDIGQQARHIHDVTTGLTRGVLTKHDNHIPIYQTSV
jgi:predicted metal-dependent enzyme (double-stranded beta helix superfamily)